MSEEADVAAWRARWFKAVKEDDLNYIQRNCERETPAHLGGFANVAIANRKLPSLVTIVDCGALRGHQAILSDLLRTAAIVGWEEAVRFLLDCGIDDLSRELPLTAAANGGNARVVEMLIEAGADPKQSNPGFWNALDFAIQKGHSEVAAILRAHGVEPSGKSFAELAELAKKI